MPGINDEEWIRLVPEIFVSYRSLNGYGAASISNYLAKYFGRKRVFRDCDSIRAGEIYPPKIRRALERCSVLVAVIGPEWLDGTATGPSRRIDDPRDWVRTELRRAFERNIRVIPVLLDNARMPDVHELPSDIRNLALSQYREVRHRNLDSDLLALAQHIDGTVTPMNNKESHPTGHSQIIRSRGRGPQTNIISDGGDVYAGNIIKIPKTPMVLARGAKRGSILGGLLLIGVAVTLIAAALNANSNQAHGFADHAGWVAPIADYGISPIVNNVTYFGDQNGTLFAYNAKTGATLWKHEFYYKLDAAPTVADGNVYVASNGHLSALRADSGQEVWSTQVDGPYGGGLVGGAGFVYLVSSDGHGSSQLDAFASADGRRSWESLIESPADHTLPVIGGSAVYVISRIGTLYALSAATGRQRWKVPGVVGLNPGPAAPSADSTSVYMVVNGVLKALDAATGRVKWTYTTEYLDNTTPAIGPSSVFVSGLYGQPGKLQSINSATGQLEWTYTGSNHFTSNPVFAGANVYITDESGSAFELDARTGCVVWSDTEQVISPDQPQLMVVGDMMYTSDSAYQIAKPAGQPSCQNTTPLHR